MSNIEWIKRIKQAKLKGKKTTLITGQSLIPMKDYVLENMETKNQIKQYLHSHYPYLEDVIDFRKSIEEIKNNIKIKIKKGEN